MGKGFSGFARKYESFDRLTLFFFFPIFTIILDLRYEIILSKNDSFLQSYPIHKLDNTRGKQYPPPLQNKNILANLPSGFSTLV